MRGFSGRYKFKQLASSPASNRKDVICAELVVGFCSKGIVDSASNGYPPVPELRSFKFSLRSRRFTPTAMITKQAQATSAALSRLRPGLRDVFRAAIDAAAVKPAAVSCLC